MASTLSDSLAAEEADELPEADEFRKPNAFELLRLAEDPCRPIYQDWRVANLLLSATCNYWSNRRTHSRAVPVTVYREFVRAEGSL